MRKSVFSICLFKTKSKKEIIKLIFVCIFIASISSVKGRPRARVSSSEVRFLKSQLQSMLTAVDEALTEHVRIF